MIGRKGDGEIFHLLVQFLNGLKRGDRARQGQELGAPAHYSIRTAGAQAPGISCTAFPDVLAGMLNWTQNN